MGIIEKLSTNHIIDIILYELTNPKKVDKYTRIKIILKYIIYLEIFILFIWCIEVYVLHFFIRGYLI